MGLLTILLELILFGILALIFYLIFRNYQLKFYFEKRGIPYIGAGYLRTFRFLRGQLPLPDNEIEFYKESKAASDKLASYADGFVTKGVVVTDLDLARNIFIKDFSYFVNRRSFKSSAKDDELTNKMLGMTEGDEWKGLRVKLSPTFTTGKIRKMFAIFDRSYGRMKDFVKGNSNGKDIDFVDLYSKYSMDVIAGCAFGIDSKTFEYELGKRSKFEEMVGRIQMNFNFIGFLKLMLLLVSPWLANKLGVDPRDHSPQRYFVGVIKSVLKHRRETGERQEDFLQMLMEVQKGVLKEENAKETLEVMHGSVEGAAELLGGSGARGFDDDDIAANCLLFLNAGFETVHSLVIWVSYVLAVEQQVQEKLRREIKAKVGGNGGKLSYDLLHEMTYLDMVINETLRYYSPAMRTERTCNKDYKVPGTDLVIEKDTLVILPIIGVHRDEKYYKNAEKFDPERFTPEEKAKRHPYSFLPFGHGPRNCIGMRFALTEAKMLIASLINDFKIEPCSKTDIPAEYTNTISVTVKPKNGMWLNVKALED